MILRYVNRSLCPCGFSVLRDEIPLGSEYEAAEGSRRDGVTLVCGGCGARHPVSTIDVRSADGRFGALPLGIFELRETPLPMRARNDENYTTHEQVAEFYNKKYIEMCGGWYTPIEELDHHLYELGLPADARNTTLVDLGSGDGQLLMRAALSGAWCHGVEISEVGRRMTLERLEALNTRAGRTHHVVLTNRPMESTGLMPASMDYAISLGSMEHALDIPAAVREMARILKPGGRWLLYVPNEEWIHEDQPLETAAPAEWWVGMLVEAGLVVGNVEKCNDNNRITGIKPRDGRV